MLDQTRTGVLKEAPLGENPLRDATKQVSLLRVEEARLQRAKMLEERKGKNVSVCVFAHARA